jgi:DNA-binding beta-propeller fold protein YncE
MAQPNFFEFLLGLLKPHPLSWQSKTKEEKNALGETALQKAGKHKLLDLNVLPIIDSYVGTSFYFTSSDVKLQTRSIIEDGVNGVSLHDPWHMCELSDGCIAVAECDDGGLIHIFRGDALMQSIGSGVISKPYGICMNSSNQLVVTDENKNQVHVFTRDGSLVRSFGSQGSDDGYLDEPGGVCVNSAGHILVADFNNHRISVFDSEGQFLRKIDGSGTGDGQLDKPISMCVDSEDNIYVVENCKHRVLKFNSYGTFVCTFGVKGSGPGQLRYPCDVCVTRDGRYIVVADSSNNRVQVLSGLDGSFVASYENVVEQFMFAHGCIVTADGRILVSDYHNNRIYEIRKA